jgi:hypothetical protein
MMKLMNDLPENVVGLLGDGQITREDYTQIITPAVKAALEKNDKVSIYYEIGDHFTGIDFGAGFEDFILGMSHIMSWKKIAIISDIEWMRRSTSFFGHFIPVEVRAFPLGERDVAKKWIAE